MIPVENGDDDSVKPAYFGHPKLLHPRSSFENRLTYCSPAADAIRKTIKKVMNCRKTTINLKRHGFCGQVQQMVSAFSMLN